MSQSTKETFADTLEELLQHNTISKITISDIVTASKLSRQTFYNNFVDIYDLIYWTHATRIKEAVDTFWQNSNFCQAFETATIIMQQHKTFYQQIVRKDGINSFQRLFAQSNIELSKLRIFKVTGSPIDSTASFLLELYWFGTAQVLVNWIEDGMKESPATLARLFYEGLPLTLRSYWPNS